MAVILVKGCGDVGSAVAHLLRGAGHAVLLHDSPRPAHTRRRMAFTDAMYEGFAELEGVLAKSVRSPAFLAPMLACGKAIPVTALPIDEIASAVALDAVVDARMRKRDAPEPECGGVVLTIGLGPNFSAGENVDVAVETEWGESLGQVVWKGPTAPLRGEPRPIAGMARGRFVYSPQAGTFTTTRQIGSEVRGGDLIGHVDGSPIVAPVHGRIRGLAHSDAIVEQGTKVLEIDPRPGATPWAGIGERPRRIAEGVLAAIASRIAP